jgi:hypothetical protein
VKCLSPDIRLNDSSVVVKGGSNGLLLACLLGSTALVAILLASRRAGLRALARRLGRLDKLRQQNLITADECQARRMQILQEI